MAPEIIAKNKYGSKVDIWSLGVLVYYIIDGNFPFDGETKSEIFQKIRYDSPPSFSNKENWEKVEPYGVEFVKLCLTRSPKLRPPASELLIHPWLLRKK